MRYAHTPPGLSQTIHSCEMLRILLLADTHLGFDFPWKPRVERRRRGPDFFANYERALEPALKGEVDLVVHGGDVLFRSKVPPRLVQMAFEPLMRVADAGVPVVVVPGNHERSAIPYPLLASHPSVHIMHSPQTVRLEIRDLRVALAGFPFERHDVRGRFPELLDATGWRQAPADMRLLCLHQTVEGAKVGPVGYTFRRGDDVIRGLDLPTGFTAVLAGHIHRRQVLEADLAGRPLAAPVFYPGSIERTSSAERNEPKGYMTLEIAPDDDGGRLESWAFHELPARPMVDVDLDPAGLTCTELTAQLKKLLATVDPDAVVRVRLSSAPEGDAGEALKATAVRRLTPSTMTLTVAWPRPAGRPSQT